MNMRSFFTAFALLLTQPAFTQPDLELIGKIDQPISPALLKKTDTLIPFERTSIPLLNIRLSKRAWEKLKIRTKQIATAPLTPFSESTSYVQLGMNNIPVLDQGPHPTCATFANIAAIEASLSLGDTISPLCHLQLGQYLENNGYTLSGWNGSFGPIVLNQIQAFGWIDQATQRAHGCGGYTEYPDGPRPETMISVSDFHALSNLFDTNDINWTSILDTTQIVDNINPNTTLQHVIDALNVGDRLTLGMLLFPNEGFVGAVGKNHIANDTWVLTPNIINAIEEQSALAGHELIITGYDNNATAIDNQGRTHKGLLTLRNSWGNNAGDHGDFYMSYGYFKALAIEVQRIRHITSA